MFLLIIFNKKVHLPTTYNHDKSWPRNYSQQYIIIIQGFHKLKVGKNHKREKIRLYKCTYRIQFFCDKNKVPFYLKIFYFFSNDCLLRVTFKEIFRGQNGRHFRGFGPLDIQLHVVCSWCHRMPEEIRNVLLDHVPCFAKIFSQPQLRLMRIKIIIITITLKYIYKIIELEKQTKKHVKYF